MSNENKPLEHNKEKVDQFMREKVYTFAEMIPMDQGLDFLEYLIKEEIDRDFNRAKYIKEREFIKNHEVFPMIYMMNILTGVGAVRRTKIILRNESAMRILGFTDKQIANGLTKRGRKNQYGEGYERQSGIMASTALIDNLACFEYQGLEECFNKYISRVAANGRIDLGEVYILDSTIVETGARYPGARLTRKKNEEWEDTDDKIWGFKVFVLTSAKTLVPVAISITTANEADSPMLVKMVEQGARNVGEGKIKTVLADRGFIDGHQMYQLKYNMDVDFVIPARKNMDIWACMTGLREKNRDNIEQWVYGKKGLSGGYLSKGSVSYGQYAAEASGHKKTKPANQSTLSL
jgi:hypothetical protein